IVLMQHLVDNKIAGMTYQEIGDLFSSHGLDDNREMVSSVVRTLSTDHFAGSSKKIYQAGKVMDLKEDHFVVDGELLEALNNNYFNRLIKDLLYTAELKSRDYDPNKPLTLYQKYMRRDALRLLGWKDQMVDQNIGGYTYDSGNKQFVIFVTLD